MFGFPAQPLPYHVYGFNQRQGAGIMGGDFSCSFSKLPGSCAFFNPIGAHDHHSCKGLLLSSWQSWVNMPPLHPNLLHPRRCALHVHHPLKPALPRGSLLRKRWGGKWCGGVGWSTAVGAAVAEAVWRALLAAPLLSGAAAAADADVAGTDGCSPPLAVLKSVGMSGNLNAFVSPSVVTLEQSESMPAVRAALPPGWLDGRMGSCGCAWSGARRGAARVRVARAFAPAPLSPPPRHLQ